ncbi:hypothetical protein E3N88_14618 [Mikania micrantha]|uniref:ABC transmembrane type-1 domain-containing protein n=1 Tax=Mikania micrantha TaxID=192012 RepID=A0A5N6P377_9ASTR|nr:hypothetical protein E3N88_14618 [Mikania micrantha]
MVNVGENRARNGVLDSPKSLKEDKFKNIAIWESARERARVLLTFEGGGRWTIEGFATFAPQEPMGCSMVMVEDDEQILIRILILTPWIASLFLLFEEEVFSSFLASRSKGEETNFVTKGEQITNAKILGTLAKYFWMKDNMEFRFRVLTAMGFLVGAKVINVKVAFLFKLAVDWLTTTRNPNSFYEFAAANLTALAIFISPTVVLYGYGIASTGASAFNELRTVVFSKVALRTIQLQIGSLNCCQKLYENYLK